MGINPKQHRFIEEYLIDFNGSAAARRAGYSYKNSDKIASQLLGKSGVCDEIEKRKAETATRYAINADSVLKELAEIAYFDPSKEIELMLLLKGDWKPTSRTFLKNIRSISISSGGISLKFVDRLQALKQLVEYLNLNDPDKKDASKAKSEVLERLRNALENRKIF